MRWREAIDDQGYLIYVADTEPDPTYYEEEGPSEDDPSINVELLRGLHAAGAFKPSSVP